MQVTRVEGRKNNQLNWLPKHDAYLKENYMQLSLLTMSLELGISTTAVGHRLKKLGLSKKGVHPRREILDEPLKPWSEVPNQVDSFYEMKPGCTYSIQVQGEPPLLGKCVAVTKYLYVVALEQYTVCFRKKDTDVRVKPVPAEDLLSQYI